MCTHAMGGTWGACHVHTHGRTQVMRKTAELVEEWVTPSLGGDPHRVYLAGQSMGGNGAWLFAAQQPRVFAAVCLASSTCRIWQAGLTCLIWQVMVVCGYVRGTEEASNVAQRLARGSTAVSVAHSTNDELLRTAHC